MVPKRLVNFLSLGLLLALAYKLVSATRWQNFFFQEQILRATAVLIAILLFFVIKSDWKSFKSTRQLKQWVPGILSLVGVFVVMNTYAVIQTTFKKPTLVRAGFFQDFNGVTIDLKTDHTYIVSNDALGLSSYKYGTYSIQDSTILLDRDSLAYNLMTRKVQIRRNNWLDNSQRAGDYYLYEISDDGKILDSSTRVRLLDDNRKSNRLEIVRK